MLAGAVLAAGLAIAGVDRTAAQDSYKWPDYFNVVTPIVGTANHSLAVAWTSEFSAQTGSRARVLPAPNGYARAQWLENGEGRISMLQASDYFDQMDAVEGFSTPDGGPFDTRVAVMNMVTPWGYMVRGDSDIKSFDDIKPGTRIAFSPSSTFLTSGVDALLAYRGLSRDDVELVEVGNYGANTRIVVEGRADVAFTSPISGTSFEADAGPNGIRWLPLPAREDDPEAFQRYRDLQPGYVPAKTVSGVKSAIGINMDHAYQANHVRADEDPEFVYNLAKWLNEHYDDFKDDYTYAPMMSVDSLKSFLDAGALQPLHEGTIRYLTELGIWNDTYQKRQDELVEMAEARVALFDKAVADAQAKGITVAPDSEEWAEFWKKTLADNGVTQPYGEAVLNLP
jgi:hypothetical protein